MTATSATPRIRRRFAGLVATVLAAALGGVAVAPQPAAAWPWEPAVTLNGKVGCNYATTNTVTWAWVEATNGEHGWATLSGSGMTRPYYFDFYNVGTGGTTVTFKWGCSTDGEHSTTFGLNRPSTGKTATRNICYWSPCSL
ncbi:hypothetical protein [Micromonospora sp. NBS 11-29]|uniref:hypothetical protein n=1 Tax=Micromonospora sp. NBS 11-29 TaxID=1960879 RepID=UPI001124943A|nr:hypothetical protein [Micromonospora sp. NBS 11-29]